ncbi:MAG: hypothetical protein ABJC09_15490, partial [Terriglobia bacterium]
TGIRHSEFNASTETTAHLLQIWILPDQFGLSPSYEEQHIARTGKKPLHSARGGNQTPVPRKNQHRVFKFLKQALDVGLQI